MSESTASYHFPVMGNGRLDYTSNCSYKTLDWSIEDGQVEITHKAEGESLVSQLIENGDAGFGCVVVIPSTMYRFISICQKTKVLSAKHSFLIENRNRSIHSIRFLPLVFYNGETKQFTADNDMGIDDVWKGQNFILHKGAIIARDGWHQTEANLSRLIKAKKDENLPKGAMEVGIVEGEGGYFLARLSADLYKGFQRANTQGSKLLSHRDSILTHALSMGLMEMKNANKSGDVSWDSLENFQALKHTLNEQHGIDLEGDFDACLAACTYLPHCLGDISKIEGDDNE